MTKETLIAQQQDELIALAALREKRKMQLKKDQLQLLKHCRFTSNKGRALINQFFSKQYQDWLRLEQDDLDRLKYAHQVEMEALDARQTKRDNLILLFQQGQEKEKSQGRGR